VSTVASLVISGDARAGGGQRLTLEGQPSSWRSTLRPSELARGPDRGAGGQPAPSCWLPFAGCRVAGLLDLGGSGGVAAGGGG